MCLDRFLMAAAFGPSAAAAAVAGDRNVLSQLLLSSFASPAPSPPPHEAQGGGGGGGDHESDAGGGGRGDSSLRCVLTGDVLALHTPVTMAAAFSSMPSACLCFALEAWQPTQRHTRTQQWT